MTAGDRVCVLGFTSVDYTTIDIALGLVGAVSVPLQTSAAIAQLQPIVLETEPTVFAASVDYLSDAVDVILAAADAGHTPAHLVVFDYRGELDDNREALQTAHERLAELALTIETLDEVRERGAALPATPVVEPDEEDPLALLIYTSGSTGAPKGAMYPQSNVAKMWNRSTKNWFGPSAASISLNFMPMSHVMGRGTLYGTLGNGGTAYFAAKSDLSTLLEDLRLVRPTELNFVPRIWEMLYSEYQSEVGRRTARGRRPSDRRIASAGRAARRAARRALHLRDDRLGTDLPRAADLGRVAARDRIWWTATAPPKPAWSCSTARSSARRSSTTSWSTFRTWATSPPTGRIRGANCC